ncbi:SHOCT domain-containing protein [Alkalibacterium putridalgicola]|uniref:Putative membrane protein n=1 Tax=Alkalibacterium putridalgicola TaxID=426703 RepID=A0A1H7SRF0_9LACT|nr:hypothetical protein [Alkalibacterium putridalgicola]GEK89162.1 hypothetical protein APU01nite_12010 [Alkalibacterium putridalgicola]SEL75151.1 putative membrane protein [Alkalibacterium putridalgicola]
MMHSMYGLFGGGFNMMFGGLFWLVLIIIFLYLLFRKVSEDNSHHHTRSRKQSALDILDEEYAKGNLSEEEYMRKKNNLRQ